MPQIIPDKIPCQTLQQFSAEVSTLKDVMSLGETEETWDRMERGIARFSAVIKGGGHQFRKELVDALKSSQREMISALNSERTRLSAAVLDCISAVAPRVGLEFEPLVSIYIPPILRLANRTNKVYVTRSHATIALIVGFCHIPSILPHLLTTCKESKITTGRTIALEGILRVLNKWDWSQKEIINKVTVVEEIIRLTGRDKDASIRQISRQVFESYKNIFPERLDEFIAPLTPVMRKYLEIKPEERGRRTAKQTTSDSTAVAFVGDGSNTLGLSVRSASSHQAGSHPPSPKSKVTRPKPVSVRTMPPPATIPNKNNPGSRPPSCPPSQDDRDNQGRQRLLSSISSTLSVKSVPATSKPLIEHRAPIRLATSQSRAVSVTAPNVTSTGQARRIRRVMSIEQTNRPDLFAMAKKAATRTLVQTNSQPSPDERSATDSKSVLAFISDSNNSVKERRGAQRVPRPVPPSASSGSKGDDKGENPPDSAASTKDPVSAKEATSKPNKPSIFRRALSADARSDPKAKSGFVPRRGGGLLQPTMSQLNKQKPPVSGAQPRSRVVSHSASKSSGIQKKVIKLNLSNSVTEPAEPIAGESSQMQNEQSTARHITNELPSVSKAEDQTEITNDDLKTERGTNPKAAKMESVESPERSVSATIGVNDSRNNQIEDENRSRESTPAPQTPSSSMMISKEVNKQVWEDVLIAPKAIRETSNISVNASETTNMGLQNDRSQVQATLVEVLVTE